MSPIRFIAVALTVWSAWMPGQAAAATPLAALTVRLADLRTGYVVAESRYVTAASLAEGAHMRVRQLKAHGWVTSYQAVFRRREDAGLQVGDDATQFRAPWGALWWYGVNLMHISQAYRTIRLPAVGDQSTAVQGRDPRTGFVAIIFRRGQYVAEVFVSERAVGALGSVLTLARLVDLRIRQEGVSPAAPQATSTPRGLFVQTWVTPPRVPYGTSPTLYVRTLPGAACTAGLVYASGQPAGSFNGYAQIADASGVVHWSWRADARGSAGTATVSCTFAGQVKTGQARFLIST